MAICSAKGVTCHYGKYIKDCNTKFCPGCIIYLCEKCNKSNCINCMLNKQICKTCDYYSKKIRICQYCRKTIILAQADIGDHFRYEFALDNHTECRNGLLCRSCKSYTCIDCCFNPQLIRLSNYDNPVCINCLVRSKL